MRCWHRQKFAMDPKLQYTRENTYTESGGSKNLIGDWIIISKIVSDSYCFQNYYFTCDFSYI